MKAIINKIKKWLKRGDSLEKEDVTDSSIEFVDFDFWN